MKKKCTRCKKLKDLEEFYAHKNAQLELIIKLD